MRTQIASIKFSHFHPLLPSKHSRVSDLATPYATNLPARFMSHPSYTFRARVHRESSVFNLKYNSYVRISHNRTLHVSHFLYPLPIYPYPITSHLRFLQHHHLLSLSYHLRVAAHSTRDPVTDHHAKFMLHTSYTFNRFTCTWSKIHFIFNLAHYQTSPCSHAHAQSMLHNPYPHNNPNPHLISLDTSSSELSFSKWQFSTLSPSILSSLHLFLLLSPLPLLLIQIDRVDLRTRRQPRELCLFKWINIIIFKIYY